MSWEWSNEVYYYDWIFFLPIRVLQHILHFSCTAKICHSWTVKLLGRIESRSAALWNCVCLIWLIGANSAHSLSSPTLENRQLYRGECCYFVDFGPQRAAGSMTSKRHPVCCLQLITSNSRAALLWNQFPFLPFPYLAASLRQVSEFMIRCSARCRRPS